MLIKVFVLIVLGAIVASLASGLVYLNRDQGGSRRTVRALTVRVSLSAALFVLLYLAYFAGWIEPHGVLPR